MRIKKSLRNIIVTLSLQCLTILITFVARKYFIDRLGEEYLGLNGIFSNILSMLSLAELGVSTALMFVLFKPIAEDDRAKIKNLLLYFKKIFIGISLAVFLIGLAAIPLLHLFIDTTIDFNNVITYYVLYLIGISLTYLFSYKKTLLVAYQDKYITSIITYSVFCTLKAAQIAILFWTGSYMWFLTAMIVFNLLEGIIVNTVTGKRYAYLKDEPIGTITREDKALVAKNVRALFFHRIGGIVINGTDSILIAKFVGLIQVGFYSNYFLITHSLNVIINQFFTGILASVGNLGTTDNKARYYEVYRIGLYVNALIFMSVTTVLWFVMSDFVSIAFSSGLLLDNTVVALILAGFLVNGMRRITVTFREAQALYWHDRFKPIVESVLNLGISVVLAIKIGMAGVFIGTFVSLMLTSFWVEPYVLFKYAFGIRLREYFKRYAYYFVVAATGFGIIYLIDGQLCLPLTVWSFAVETVAYTTIAVLIFVAGTCKTAEFKALWKLFYGLVLRKKNDNKPSE